LDDFTLGVEKLGDGLLGLGLDLYLAFSLQLAKELTLQLLERIIICRRRHCVRVLVRRSFCCCCGLDWLMLI
jgi:hypothetical protein